MKSVFISTGFMSVGSSVTAVNTFLKCSVLCWLVLFQTRHRSYVCTMRGFFGLLLFMVRIA